MKSIGWLGALLVFCVLTGSAQGRPGLLGHKIERVNKHLKGRLVDFTRRHGADNRIWSTALCQKRDMYVYLPPRRRDACAT